MLKSTINYLGGFFGGRVNSRTYVFGHALLCMVAVAAIALAVLIGNVSPDGDAPIKTALAIFLIILFPALLVLSISLSVRRLHDYGNNGLLIFIPLSPLWNLFKESQPTANRYGAPPPAKGRVIAAMFNLSAPGSDA